MHILETTTAIARKFGEVRAGLMDHGLPTPDLDLLNAATALENNLTVVTHNSADYQNVPSLRLQDWLIP